MTDRPPVPEFAVLGHPNEGKSSVVSTLTEDDSVRVSSFPGETTECRIFPVVIDGMDVIRFTDTPGFQAPRQTLDWFENNRTPSETIVKRFIGEHRNHTGFKDEVELFGPVERGAGIIYVADGSRPVRSNDLAEMKILRLTGSPRIAIINNKTDETRFNPQWEKAFAEHFGTVVYFNAHHASYRERIFLLEQISTIDERLGEPFSQVITAFKNDWSRRNTLVSEIILNLVETCLFHTVTKTIRDKSMKDLEKNSLITQWNGDISAFEQTAHQRIRALFKHNIFNILLPDHSMLSKDLFDSETWRTLGLTRTQLAATAATIGGAAAAVIDLAVAGHSLGLFTLIGGAAGAGSALLGSKKIGRAKLLGKTLGGYTLTVGPHRNALFMFILLDRSLLFYNHIINWAHGKRSQITHKPIPSEDHIKGPGFTSHWPKDIRNIFMAFFSSLKSENQNTREKTKKHAMDALKTVLDTIPDGK